MRCTGHSLSLTDSCRPMPTILQRFMPQMNVTRSVLQCTFLYIFNIEFAEQKLILRLNSQRIVQRIMNSVPVWRPMILFPWSPWQVQDTLMDQSWAIYPWRGPADGLHGGFFLCASSQPLATKMLQSYASIEKAFSLWLVIFSVKTHTCPGPGRTWRSECSCAEHSWEPLPELYPWGCHNSNLHGFYSVIRTHLC